MEINNKVTKLFDDYLFRCHSVSAIIPNQKTRAITDTMKKEYRRHFTEWMTGEKLKLNTKYFDKGIACEPQAISLLQDCLYPASRGHGLLSRKKKRHSNEFVTGEPDVVIPKTIVWDIKNSYNEYTFMSSRMTQQYEDQLQAYMWLLDLDKAALFYTLVDTPEFLIQRDLRKDLYEEEKSWTPGDEYDEEYIKHCDLYRKKCAYSTYMQPYERFKIFETKRDEDRIAIIKESVLIGRENMNAMYDEYISHINKNKQLMNHE